MINLPVKMKEQTESGSVFTIELYEVYMPNTVLRFCACDENIEYNGQTYLAVPVQRGEISKNVDLTADTCELSVSNTTDYFTQLLFSGINFIGSKVYIYQILYPDALTDINNIRLLFYGIVDTPELTSDGVFKVQVTNDMPLVTGGRKMHLPCNATFGDSICGIKPKTLTGSIVEIVENTSIRLSSLQDSATAYKDWLHGILVINGEGRYITNVKSNGWIEIEYPFLQNIEHAKFEMIQGCDKTQSDCSRYDNRKRYSGFPSVPYEYEIKT